MQLVLPIIIAMLAGASIVTQQALNTNLRFALDSTVWPGFISYFVGLMSMVVFAIAMREPLPAFGVMARVPWWAYSGGFFGAVFIAAPCRPSARSTPCPIRTPRCCADLPLVPPRR